jgi:hypothetical protein
LSIMATISKKIPFVRRRSPVYNMVMRIALLLVLLCGLLHVAQAQTAPKEIYLGGIFAPVSPQGVLSLDQQEHLAAFVMAVNEINDKTDGVHDDLLPDTVLKFAAQNGPTMKTAATNFITLSESFDNKGLFGVVNSLPPTEGMYVVQLAVNMLIPNILSVTNNGELNEHSTYPYMTKVVALESHQGYATQKLLCSYGPTTKFAFGLSLAEEDIEAYYEFAYSFIVDYFSGECANPILGLMAVRTDTTDMSIAVAQAKAFGARYFLLLLPAYQVAALLEQGYAAGVFTDETVIITTNRGSTNITDYFSDGTDIANVMTGFFTMEYLPNYNMNRTLLAREFANRWRNQPSHAGEYVGGRWVCDNSTDDDGNFYLYQTTVNGTTLCTGLNFSRYEETGLNIQPYTALTYDATFMMAKAVDSLITLGWDYTDPDVLQYQLTSMFLDGVTGHVNLTYGQYYNQLDTQGERLSGLVYSVQNFNPDMYNNGTNDFFVHVGYYNTDTGSVEACAPVDNIDCFAPTYGVATDGSYSNPPPDAPPTIQKHISSSLKMVCFVCAGLLTFLVLLFGIMTVYYRQTRVVKASQPILVACILIGGLFAAARIVVGVVDKNREICVAEFWTGHMAYVIIVGSLFVKSYRVHCIVNTKQLRRVTFSALDAFKMLVAIVVGLVVYLAFATKFGQPDMRVLEETISNQQTVWKFCGVHNAQFQSALYACEIVLLIVCFRTCWEIRNVPDIVNESKQISSTMSVIVLVSVLLLPIISFLGLPPYTNEFIAALAFGIGSIVTLCLLFVPKIIAIKSSRGNENRHGQGKIALAETPAQSATAETATLRQRKSRFVQEAEELLREKNQAEQLVFCQEQLVGWQAMVLNVQGRLMRESSPSLAHSFSMKPAFPLPEMSSRPSHVPPPHNPNNYFPVAVDSTNDPADAPLLHESTTHAPHATSGIRESFQLREIAHVATDNSANSKNNNDSRSKTNNSKPTNSSASLKFIALVDEQALAAYNALPGRTLSGGNSAGHSQRNSGLALQPQPEEEGYKESTNSAPKTVNRDLVIQDASSFETGI